MDSAYVQWMEVHHTKQTVIACFRIKLSPLSLVLEESIKKL